MSRRNLPQRADKRTNGLQVRAQLGRMRQLAKLHPAAPPAPDLTVCPHCKAELGEGGIRAHECEGLRAAVEASAKLEFDRVVLDVEMLAYRKSHHAPCGSRGWFKRYLIPSGATLRAVELPPDQQLDGVFATPSGKDCGKCKGAKTVPMPGAAGEAGAVEACVACNGSGKEEPKVELSICPCAASRFAKANRGLFVPVADRFHWLKGKAPPMPKAWRSPLEDQKLGTTRVQAPARPTEAQIAKLVNIPPPPDPLGYQRAVGQGEQLTTLDEKVEQVFEEQETPEDRGIRDAIEELDAK